MKKTIIRNITCFCVLLSFWFTFDGGYDAYTGLVGYQPSLVYNVYEYYFSAGVFYDSYNFYPVISVRYELKLWGKDD